MNQDKIAIIKLMRSGTELYKEKKYHQALLFFDRVVTICRTNIRILENQHNSDHKTLMHYCSVKVSNLRMKAYCFNALKRYSETENSCAEAIKVLHVDIHSKASIFSLLGCALYHQRANIPAAIGALKASVLLNPTIAANYNNLIEYLLYQKKYNESEQWCKKLKISNPTDLNILAILGYSLWKQGKLQELTAMVSESRKNNSQLINKISNSYITALEKKGKYKEIQEVCDLLIAFNNKNFCLYFKRATALEKQGLYEESIEDFNKAIKYPSPPPQSHNHAKVYCKISQCLRKLNKFEEAKKYAEKAIELQPDHYQMYFNLGCFLNECEDPNKALEVLVQAQSLNDSTPDLKLNCIIANILRQQGQFANAKYWLDAVIKINPKYLESSYILVDLLRQQNKLTGAIQVMDKVIESELHPAKAYYIKASLLCQREEEGDNKQAEECFKQAAKLDITYLNYLEVNYRDTINDTDFDTLFCHFLDQYTNCSEHFYLP